MRLFFLVLMAPATVSPDLSPLTSHLPHSQSPLHRDRSARTGQAMQDLYEILSKAMAGKAAAMFMYWFMSTPPCSDRNPSESILND